MKLSNTDQHYGTVAIALHWLMASLIVALAALGIYMVRLPDVGFNSTKIILILVHKQIGMLVLALAGTRLTWRLQNPLPGLVGTIPEWQKVTAGLVHLGLYTLMFTLPRHRLGYVLRRRHSGLVPRPIHVARFRFTRRHPVWTAEFASRLMRLRNGSTYLPTRRRGTAASLRASR